MSTRFGFVVALLGCLAGPLQAQDVQTGDLLIASEAMEDPEFARTVLLVLHHDDDGSLAVFLNRPTWVSITEAFPDIDAVSRYDGQLFRGGPVGPTQLLALHDTEAGIDDQSTRVLAGVYLSATFDALNEADNWPPAIRFYAGHAAWAPDQLAEEIEQGQWLIRPGSREVVFTRDYAHIWESVIKQGAAGLLSATTPSRPYREGP
jgi:putative transcriptional regulator